MAVFKCKMCGGSLEISDNKTVAVCHYCETAQTVPVGLGDERKANLYDRANHFRRNNEFDKAMAIYENILNEDKTDAESYWSIVLCRYGIEYVEDPATHKRVPTVNRAQYTSVFMDEDYKSAIQYADAYQRIVYESEARTIDDIQKGILEISQKEEPFDVFICYKETDANGRRTPDSVLATELYHELVKEGFKVFFSRITLEDKLGMEYEPYIFAALNSSKVMVAIGTKPENFEAVWVRNEWSRYLSLIRNGAKKVLIPAYRDMDPYNLPEEFSHLQAQDMSKLGFMQDLVRGIRKIAGGEEHKQQTVEVAAPETSAVNSNVSALIDRAFMALEDGEFNRADEFCEQVLNMNSRNSQAYLGKLLAELKISKTDDMKKLFVPLDENGNYKKIMRFADDDLKKELAEYNSIIIKNKEEKDNSEKYNYAKEKMATAQFKEDYVEAANVFAQISAYRDSAKLMQTCQEKVEKYRADFAPEELEEAYELAMQMIKKDDLKNALDILNDLGDYKDSKAKKEEATEAFYNRAGELAEDKYYFMAAEIYEYLGNYKDSSQKAEECVELQEKEDDKYKNIGWVILGVVAIIALIALFGLG